MGAYFAGAILRDRNSRHLAFARLVSSAVTSQVLLSAASFAIGLILIRRTSDVQYGYYILATNAILLLASLQNALFNPPLAIRMSRLDLPGRSGLVGGLYREQRRIVPMVGATVFVIALGAWYAGVLDAHTGPLVLVTVAAAIAVLHREYFRMVLFAHRRSYDVLRTDVFYVALLVGGALVATLTPAPAFAAVLTLSVAAVAGGILLSRTLRRHEPWNPEGAPGILRDIGPLAAWSTAGAGVNWAFSQGYIYLVAGTLDLTAVAAIAATRLLLMPVNLLASGMGPLMLPLASGWLHRHGAQLVLRRLCLLALGLGLATLCYFAILWLLRDWIFTALLKKQFAQRDALLLLWGATFLVSSTRGQLAFLLAAQGRFRALTSLTVVCAPLSLAASYWGMLRFGVAGAVAGILIGESLNAIGIAVLALRAATPRRAQPALPGLPSGVPESAS
jgi:O-antigen/teichoic acid export membrane protein